MDATTITTGQGVTHPETKEGLRTVTIDALPATTIVTNISHLLDRVAQVSRTEAMAVVTTDLTAITTVDTILAVLILTRAENLARNRITATSINVAITRVDVVAAKTTVVIGMITTKTQTIKEDRTEDKVAATITDLLR